MHMFSVPYRGDRETPTEVLVVGPTASIGAPGDTIPVADETPLCFDLFAHMQYELRRVLFGNVYVKFCIVSLCHELM